ncbi:MAG: sugar MFS transporter [Bacteroidia bacterium]|nr:sugar MFS transporter [Bacteroidia bacterium]
MASSKQSTGSGRNYLISISIIGVLYFIFGFVTWLNGSLMPFLQTACELTPFEASLVVLAFYIAYFVMALPSSFVLKRTGYKNGVFIGLLIMAVGALIFIPAAYSRMFGVFLAGLFILGTGLALLQTATNPFITIIGPRESAAKRMAIMGICNKMAGVISPLVLTAMIMHGMDKFSESNLALLSLDQKNLLLNELASRIVIPYLGMAILLVLFGILVRFSSLPNEIDIEEDDHETLRGFVKQIPAALKIPHLLLGVITIFVYVGVEVMAADSLTQFGRSLHLSYAPKLTSFTMAFMVFGYILGIVLIPKVISQAKALLFSAVLGVLFAFGAIYSSQTDNNLFAAIFGWMNKLFDFNIPLIPNALFFVTLLGWANALMWPAIWPLALNNLGKYTKIGSALLIMGIAGGALIPPTYAKIGQSIGFQTALWIMVPLYLFILFYAISGHKAGLKDGLRS